MTYSEIKKELEFSTADNLRRALAELLERMIEIEEVSFCEKRGFYWTSCGDEII